MLVIADIVEAIEADRKGDKSGLGISLPVKQDLDKGEAFEDVFVSHIKNTLEDKMAGVAIRIADIAGKIGINFDKIETCGLYHEFDEHSFVENAFSLTSVLCSLEFDIDERILFGLDYVFSWAESLNIDLWFFIEQKMKYNELKKNQDERN